MLCKGLKECWNFSIYKTEYISFKLYEMLSSVLDEYDSSGEVGISLNNATENEGKISCKFVRLMNHILLVLLSKDCFLVDPFPVCNLAKGKWDPDNRQPLYSGFECKQCLSEMW
ncbi:hypothetical protein VIGAN_02298000 [Vigna angularis var. angularis]|uniref:Uncharacterized protein n=1 Tax=Vigna angularis var. angularis TaxID=157739 RepID=A0A0S3RHA6_PHAAN|nr:protein trichome birefringence-like 14 isoform X1 [Vigna angularis]BAT80021.1 hypothetical protein VIGAN_02298000 [Vigna angularis var. angularis]